jgi:L-threonylcarbamoyladenylate synthase
MLITANTGSVGLRMPNHPSALELLKESGVPIAAPSANKFGHVSPTKPEHVYNDFHLDSEIAILDGGQCNFGIESTVLKIIEHSAMKFELHILRKGGVSEKALVALYEENKYDLEIEVTKKAHFHFKEEDENLEGPGQFLRHYSPNIESFLFNGTI